MSKVLVLVEHKDGTLKNYSKELLSQARKVSSELGAELCALYFSSETTLDLASEGVLKVFAGRIDVDQSCAKATSEILDKAISDSGATYVFATSSFLSKSCLPRIAARRDAALATECNELFVDAGKLAAKRAMYSGKLSTHVSLAGDLQLFTFRPNSFETKASEASAAAELVEVSGSGDSFGTQFLSREEAKSDRPDLVEAEIVVSAGRSIKSEENFAMIYDFADSIGAAAGASRAAVDADYAPHSIQVGQTGKTVSPKLYLAFGISGAIQHLAGMSSSKVIVAVNTDPEAPIFQKCDYGIVGDMFDLIPLFKEEFAKISSQ